MCEVGIICGRDYENGNEISIIKIMVGIYWNGRFDYWYRKIILKIRERERKKEG